MPKVGALAICKAHPFVFCAFVAVALGIVVYQVVKSKKKKQKKHTYSDSTNRPDDEGRGAGGTPDFYYYDASTKTVTNSAAPVNSDASENNLRRRPAAKNSSSSITNDQSKAANEKESKLSVSREVQTESVDNNQNDINKVLPDKDLNSAMSADERVNNFLRNIPVPDSGNIDESSSQNSIIKPVRNCCCDCDSHYAGSSCSSSSSSISSSWSDVSVTDVDNIKKRKKSRKSRAASVCSIESESSVGTVLSGDSVLCRGCEEKPVNTHAQPCNHRYLCSDCAMRFFRLYKKCKVCRAKIERVVFED